MKNLLLLLCVLSGYYVCGQERSANYATTINPNQREKALTYYDRINKAELAICDSNFSEANKYYAQAFTVNPDKPFSKHLANAFFSAMDDGQYALAEKYISKLLARGIGRSFIDSNIRKYYTGDTLKRINTMLAKYRNDTLRKDPLIAKLYKMQKWDQDVRFYFWELYNGAYMVDSTYNMDSVNSMQLLKIFKTKGIPNQATYGNSLLYDHSPFSSPVYDIMISHNSAGTFAGKPAHIFDTLLYQAVFNFDYDVDAVAEQLQVNAVKDSFCYGNTTLHFPLNLQGAFYDHKIYPECWDEASEKRMNEDRKKLGLSTLEEFRKKIASSNARTTGNSVLSKYAWSVNISVVDEENETELNKWLAINGKNAEHKRSIFSVKYRKPAKQHFEIGELGDYDSTMGFGSHHLNKTRFPGNNTYISKSEFYIGKLPYKNRGYRKFQWNIYWAEIIKDVNNDISTDSSRYDMARFPDGYRMWIETGMSFYFGHFGKMESLFYHDTLIHFSAVVDTAFYRGMIRRFGAPDAYTVKRDTLACPIAQGYVVYLATRKYTWTKGNNRVDVISTQTMNDKCMKRTNTMYYMYDTVKYAAYLAKVKEEKKRLDKEYLAKKK